MNSADYSISYKFVLKILILSIFLEKSFALNCQKSYEPPQAISFKKGKIFIVQNEEYIFQQHIDYILNCLDINRLIKLAIVGHTSIDEENSLGLSRSRAEYIANKLIESKIDFLPIYIMAAGSSIPIYPNTEAYIFGNRRVNIFYCVTSRCVEDASPYFLPE